MWMTRSPELWIDGNTGHDVFLSHSRSARQLSRSRSVTGVLVQAEHSGWKQTTRRLNSRDKLQQLWFTTSVMTTMKSPHLLSAEIDLLTRMISSGATYDFVKTNFALVVPRQVSPNLAHALLFARFLGRRPLLLDRVFHRVC